MEVLYGGQCRIINHRSATSFAMNLVKVGCQRSLILTRKTLTYPIELKSKFWVCLYQCTCIDKYITYRLSTVWRSYFVDLFYYLCLSCKHELRKCFTYYEHEIYGCLNIDFTPLLTFVFILKFKKNNVNVTSLNHKSELLEWIDQWHLVVAVRVKISNVSGQLIILVH